MIKIRMLSTGEIREVTPNVAHDLIDSKKAEVYKPDWRAQTIDPTTESFSYSHRQMRASIRDSRGV